MLDLKITDGTIVDGSGAPRYRGDVGIKDGLISVLGKVEEPALDTIDAAQRIVAPGFIDLHTHYDAQVFWDPTLSPSCYHGVTTIVGGFCGFSIAPLSDGAADYLMRMLGRVEGMPLETLRTAVPWSWHTFGDYLASFEGKVGLNAGFYVGHSAIRRAVMGERAVGEKCTSQELGAMKVLLGQSLAQGALGFSTSISPSHNDGEGEPVPSRWADYSEIIELARVVGDYEGTGLELLPELDFAPQTMDLITDFSIAGNRPVNWNVLVVTGRDDIKALARRQLSVSDYARQRGGDVLALTVPTTPDTYVNFKGGFVLDIIPGIWRELFKWPIDRRISALRESSIRKQMEADAASLPHDAVMAPLGRLDNYFVISVTAEKNKKYQGMRIGDIAHAEGRAPIDVMLDIALDDDLTAIFAPNYGGHGREAYELRGKLWHDDRTLIGASDAGAHLDVIDTFSFATAVLQKGVREHGVISLEEAIYQMTDRPARYLGLIGRGQLKVGYHADVVVFDDATIGRGPASPRYDLPGTQEHYRLYTEATGIDHVFVNGVEIVRHGHHTARMPGTVLRSGRDTRTVALNAMREGRTCDLETPAVSRK